MFLWFLMDITGVTFTPAHEKDLIMMQLFRDDYFEATQQVAKLEAIYTATVLANEELHENIANKVKKFAANVIPESVWAGDMEGEQIPIPTEAMHVFNKKSHSSFLRSIGETFLMLLDSYVIPEDNFDYHKLGRFKAELYDGQGNGPEEFVAFYFQQLAKLAPHLFKMLEEDSILKWKEDVGQCKFVGINARAMNGAISVRHQMWVWFFMAKSLQMDIVVGSGLFETIPAVHIQTANRGAAKHSQRTTVYMTMLGDRVHPCMDFDPPEYVANFEEWSKRRPIRPNRPLGGGLDFEEEDDNEEGDSQHPTLTEETLQVHESICNAIREEDDKDKTIKRLSRTKALVIGHAEEKEGLKGKEASDTPASSVIRQHQREEYRRKKDEEMAATAATG